MDLFFPETLTPDGSSRLRSVCRIDRLSRCLFSPFPTGVPGHSPLPVPDGIPVSVSAA